MTLRYATQHQARTGPVTTIHDTEAAAEEHAARLVADGTTLVVVYALDLEETT